MTEIIASKKKEIRKIQKRVVFRKKNQEKSKRLKARKLSTSISMLSKESKNKTTNLLKSKKEF